MPVVGAPPDRVPWLRASRFQHWFHFLVLPLAGYDGGSTAAVNALALGRGVVIAFAILAFGFLINQVADRHMDASAAKNPLARRRGRRLYWGPLGALVAVAVAMSLLGPLAVTIATAVALGSGAVYSVGPRIKRFPVVGTLANATNFAPLLWVGLPHAAIPAGMVELTVCFALLLLQNQLVHEAADREDDRRGNVRTTVLVVGTLGGALGCAALGGLLVAVVILTPQLAALAIPFGVVFLLAVPLAVARRGTDTALMARARIAHRVASAAAGVAIFALLRLG